MLQQTQVATVIPYYEKFLARCGDVVALADASETEVMSLWAGLGYYSRARNLHKCAQQVRDRFNGQFPTDMDDLVSLPGIGESTAAAIAVFAFGQRQSILDGNVKRVFTRYFGIDGVLEQNATINQLWALADEHLPRTNPVAYTQGLMDLGATCCTRTKPRCDQCPVASTCVALADNRVSELPVRRKKKPIPERDATMLVFCCATGSDCQVLVQQRPATGIWGGLMSLPESTASADAPPDQLLRGAGHGLMAGDATQELSEWRDDCTLRTRLDPIAHAFTHYRLKIYPVVFDVRNPGRLAQGQWLGKDNVDTAPLPAPVKKLIQTVLELP